MPLPHQIGHALLMSLGMMWQTGWTLVLGFAVSAVLQTVVPASKMREALGGGGAKDIAAATALGAASSSCRCSTSTGAPSAGAWRSSWRGCSSPPWRSRPW